MRSLALLFIAATALQGQVTTPGIIAKPSASALIYGQSLSYSVLSGGSAGNEFVVTTLAGSTEGYQDGVAEVAQFKYPQGLAIDADKNVYVADTQNNRIRKVTPSGVVTTVAGNGRYDWGVDGYGEETAFKNPSNLAVDPSGNLYVSDTENHRIRRITPDTQVSSVYFEGEAYSPRGYSGILLKGEPLGITVGPDGNVYHVERKCYHFNISDVDGIYRFRYEPNTINWLFQMFAQSTNGPGGFENYGRYSYRLMVYASDLAIDRDKNIYVVTGKSGFNQAITKVTPNGITTRLAGSDAYYPTDPYSTNRFADGLGSEARFFCPSGITIDSSGNLYVADTFNHRIRKVTPAGLVTTIAGTGAAGFQDGPVATAKFNYPYGIAVDSSANIYVADTYNQRIRKITPANNVAGTWAWASPTQIPPSGTTPQTVTFTPQDQAEYVSFTTTVDVTVAKASPTIISSPTASAIYYGQALSSSFLSGGSATVGGNFSWSDSSTTPGVGISSQRVTFFPSESANYNIATTSVNVTVNKATPVINSAPTATQIIYGQTLASSTLSGGSASVAGRFAWTTPSTAPGAGTSVQNVTFTPNDTANYNTVTRSVSVTVNKTTPVITTAPTPASFTYGNLLGSSTLSGGSASVAGNFSWTTPATVPAVGTTVQNVTFTPTDLANYNTVTTSVNFRVNKTTPIINSAPTAAPIPYGQTLASSNLSGGVATVAGKFAWTTPSTAPAVGTTAQNVTFTPTDTANYNTATTTVSVIVNPTITSDLSAVTVTLGANYSYQVTGSGSPTSFQVTGLPKGLSVKLTSGRISGAPTQTGSYSVILRSLSGRTIIATATKVFTVVQIPTYTYAAKINAQRGKSFKVAPTIASYPAPTFSIISGSLPPGLYLNASTATITGRPTTAGSYAFTVRGSNSAGNTDRSVTIVVK